MIAHRVRHPGTLPAVGAVMSLIVLWCCSGVLAAQSPAPSDGVHQDQIFVSLPIAIGAFVTSIVCVWKIAALVTTHLRRMDDLAAQMVELQKQGVARQDQSQRLEQQIDELLGRIGGLEGRLNGHAS